MLKQTKTRSVSTLCPNLRVVGGELYEHGPGVCVYPVVLLQELKVGQHILGVVPEVYYVATAAVPVPPPPDGQTLQLQGC